MPSFMELALDEARKAQDLGEVPIGCVIVRDGVVIAAAGNRTLTDRDPTAHAEMLAIRAAAREARLRAPRSIATCMSRSSPARCARRRCRLRAIRRLYYGAPDPKGGAIDNGVRFFASPTCHHRPEVYGGISEAASGSAAARLLRGAALGCSVQRSASDPRPSRCSIRIA